MQFTFRILSSVVLLGCLVLGARWFYSTNSEKFSSESTVALNELQKGATDLKKETPLPVHIEHPAHAFPRDEVYYKVDGRDRRELWSAPTVSYWKQLLDPSNHQGMVVFEFSRFLEKEGDPRFFEDLQKIMSDPQVSPHIKKRTLSLLGETPRKEFMEILVESLSNTNDKSVRSGILNRIPNLPARSQLKDKAVREGISEPVEDAWLTVDDEMELNALASALARLGTTGGVGVLADALSNGPDTLQKLEHRGDIDVARARAAFRAASEIEVNREATFMLTEHLLLNQSHLDDPLFLFSGNALSSLATQESASALIQWAKNAPDEAAPLARQWFAGVMALDESEKRVEKAVVEADVFYSDKVRQEIAQALQDHKGVDGMEYKTE